MRVFQRSCFTPSNMVGADSPRIAVSCPWTATPEGRSREYFWKDVILFRSAGRIFKNRIKDSWIRILIGGNFSG
jgi:hypothetical protein